MIWLVIVALFGGPAVAPPPAPCACPAVDAAAARAELKAELDAIVARNREAFVREHNLGAVVVPGLVPGVGSAEGPPPPPLPPGG
jgi:hypothetical protein